MKKLLQCGERGAAAVELALVFPILAMLLFGVLEGGRYYHAKNTATHAAREGARVLALGGDGALATARVLDTAAGLPVTVDFPDGATCVPPSTVDPDGVPAKVRASVDFEFNIPFVSVAIPDVEATAVMRCGG